MLSPAAALSIIDSHAAWWSLAGVETVTGEIPVNWLAAPAPLAIAAAGPTGESAPDAAWAAKVRRTPAADPMTRSSPLSATPLAPLAMPDEWQAFHAWLENDPAVPGTRWHTRRILPHGRQGARLMLVSLCPEMADQDTGMLHSGSAGQLLDAMLRAIGLERADCYLASAALTRPPGGRIDDGDLAALAPLLWHHVRIAQPARLLLFGTDITRLMAATDVVAARGMTLNINQDGVSVEAVATQHPLLLLDRPARKAAAWDSLKRLAQE